MFATPYREAEPSINHAVGVFCSNNGWPGRSTAAYFMKEMALEAGLIELSAIIAQQDPATICVLEASLFLILLYTDVCLVTDKRGRIQKFVKIGADICGVITIGEHQSNCTRVKTYIGII